MISGFPYAVRSNFHFPGITLIRHAVRGKSDAVRRKLAPAATTENCYAVRSQSVSVPRSKAQAAFQ